MKELKGHTYEANIGYHSEPQEGECSQVIPKATGQSKTCKCGSTSHKRTTHKDCPLKAKSVSADSVEHSEVESDYDDLPSENSLLDSSEDESFFHLLMLKQICVIVEGHIREIVHIILIISKVKKCRPQAVTVAKGKHHLKVKVLHPKNVLSVHLVTILLRGENVQSLCNHRVHWSILYAIIISYSLNGTCIYHHYLSV